MKNLNFKKIFWAAILVLLAIGERLWFDLGPNIELVTTATILSALYLGRNFAIIAPLIILAITDSIIGNTRIMIFTWSAFALEGAALFLVNKLINFRQKRTIIKLFSTSCMGVGASVWFYLWTNFGVWLLDSWGMYSRDLSGLINCFIMGIPFLKMSLLGNLTFPFAGVISAEVIVALDNLRRRGYLLLSPSFRE